MTLTTLLAACQPLPSSPPGPTAIDASPATAASASSGPVATATPEPAPTPFPSGVVAALTITLTQPEGRPSIDVLVLDRTGLMVGIAAAMPESASEGLTDASAPEQGVVYQWLTGACDLRTVITLEPADRYGTDQDTYRLTALQEGTTGGCLAIEIPRAVVISLREPIAASRIDVISGIKASFRSTFDGYGGREPTEFALLDRTGLVTGLAIPTKPKRGGISAAKPTEVGLLYFPVPGDCVYRMAMVFEKVEADRYRLLVFYDLKWVSWECAGSARGRWVLIRLREPIPADQVQEVGEAH